MFDIGILATGPEFAIISLLAAGTAVATYGTIQQGRAAETQTKAEQDILNYNAQQKIKEAEEIRAAAKEEAAKFEKRARRFKGTQRVAIARAGVLSTIGTPALLLEETAQELEADRISILKQGYLHSEYAESEAFGMRFRGTAAKERGKNIKRGSQLAAAGSLLTGIGDIGLTSYKLKED